MMRHCLARFHKRTIGKWTLKAERKKTGGLHLTFRDVGEKILINHAGEQLEIVWQGKQGVKQHVFSIIAPKSFEIKGPTK